MPQISDQRMCALEMKAVLCVGDIWNNSNLSPIKTFKEEDIPITYVLGITQGMIQVITIYIAFAV